MGGRGLVAQILEAPLSAVPWLKAKTAAFFKISKIDSDNLTGFCSFANWDPGWKKKPWKTSRKSRRKSIDTCMDMCMDACVDTYVDTSAGMCLDMRHRYGHACMEISTVYAHACV